MGIYAKHPGFTPLKDSIQPQKIWNNYNIKKTLISNFHAGTHDVCTGHLPGRSAPVHAPIETRDVTSVTKCDRSVTILRRHVRHRHRTSQATQFLKNVFK